jgi:uncharacterized protein (DUF1499 family)
MRTLAVVGLIVILLPLLVLAAGQLGWLAGHPPNDLGVRDGKLKPPSRTENSVSSQANQWPEGAHASRYAQITPLAAGGNGNAQMGRLRALLAAWPGTRVVEDRADYLRVEFTTRWLRFVDDAEFWFDPASNVIHVRSASRLGRKDLGVNRARIEAIRAQLHTAGT